MRIDDLYESQPGQKGITTQKDVEKWLEKIHKGDATGRDIEIYDSLKKITKKLGGRTTVIEVLKKCKF